MDRLKLEPPFPAAHAGEEVFSSGLPVDELPAAAPPVTAKPSKFTHSGSEGKGEGQAARPSSLDEGCDSLLSPVISPRRNKQQDFIYRNRWCFRAAGGTVATQHGAQCGGCQRRSKQDERCKDAHERVNKRLNALNSNIQTTQDNMPTRTHAAHTHTRE